MGSIARKVLTESVGQAVVTMAAASSSTPPPFLNEDGSYLTSPLSTSPGLKPITAIVIVFLFVAFFLVGFFSIHFQRCCYTHGARIGDSDSPPTVMQGLDLSILETLPKVIFSSSSVSVQPGMKGRSKKEMTECAICLEEFSEHETLRLLPHCGHTFHLDCINVWLSSHTTCPLCRRSLLPSKPDPDTIAIGVAYLNGAVVIGEELRNNGAASMMDVASSVTSGALQRRALEDPENPGEEGGGLSDDRAELQRSHSMGYDHLSSLAKGKPPAASSSPSSPLLLFFIAHRSSSCTALLNLSAASQSEPTETNPPRRKGKKRERTGFSAAMGGLSDGEFSPPSSSAAPPSSSSSSRS